MTRRLWLVLYLLALAALAGAWVRSAWLMPLRNLAWDFVINYTGSRLLSVLGPDGPLYDRVALANEALPYFYFPSLYTKLYLTYIQTPLTAVLTIPFSRMPFDDARLVYLIFSNVLLVTAAALLVWSLRPSKLLVFSVFFIFGTYEAMFDSLRLGNVDALIVISCTLSFVLLRRDRLALGGAPLALAVLLKLSPALVLGYFLVWRRWRVVAGAVGAGAALLALAVAVAGVPNHVTFVRDISPMLSKGSSFYDNISLAAAALRAWLGPGSWYWEDVVPEWPLGLRLVVYTINALLVLGTYRYTRRDWEAGFMLALAVALIVSPVTWSFYPTWLIPPMLWIVRRAEDRRAWGTLAALLALYPLLAIVPAHYSMVSEQLYRYPIKPVALTLFALLVALQTGRATDPAAAAARDRHGASGRAPALS